MTWADDLWGGFSDSDKEKIILKALDNFFDPSSDFQSEKIGALLDEERFAGDKQLQVLMGQLVDLFQDEADENPDFDITNVVELKDFQGK